AAERCGLKLFPCDFESQGPAYLFTRLRADGLTPHDITAIEVRTYEVSWRQSGGGHGDHGEKWKPQRRQTADHSLPYVVAAPLTGRAAAEDLLDALWRLPELDDINRITDVLRRVGPD